jgi:hypothetical protein
VDGTDAELTFYSRNEGRTLEEGTSERLESSRKRSGVREIRMQAEYTDVFLSYFS